MTIKTFERPLINLAHELVHHKAHVVDREYKISVTDLTAHEKSLFLTQFITSINSFDAVIQEYLNDAALDRSYAENECLIWGNYE